MIGTLMTRALRGVGWLCVTGGAVIVLYLVYSLLFTNVATQRSQEDLLERWELEVGAVEADPVVGGPPQAGPAAEVIDPGTGLAVLQFDRPGSAEPVVSAEPLFVVEGVGVDDLKRGPGHYPDSDMPGASGNFAIAGHRSTYGAPFFRLEELVAGDEVWVTDRSGKRFTYRVSEQRIVAPDDRSVLVDDPLGSGRPTLTLTTCHPRFSNAQRLIVLAELVA